MTQECQAIKCPMSHVSCNRRPYKHLGGLSYSAIAMTGSERFGGNLREWRNRRKLTQDTLGEKIGSDGPRVSRLERGEENPTLDTIDKLGVALEIDVSYFHIPRPEEDTGHVGPGRPRDSDPVLEAIRLQQLDSETPAEDSTRGDILKAQSALATANAALNRALRRPDAKSGVA